MVYVNSKCYMFLTFIAYGSESGEYKQIRALAWLWLLLCPVDVDQADGGHLCHGRPALLVPLQLQLEALLQAQLLGLAPVRRRKGDGGCQALGIPLSEI